MSDSVSLSTVEAWISDYEAGLRSAFPDDKLPAEWEAELQRINRSTVEGALRYWGALKAFVFAVHDRKRDRGAGNQEAETAAFELLARTPIPVPLASGRQVAITGRSLLALTEMAAHEGRITLLQAQQEEATALYAELARAHAKAKFRARRRIRRKMRRVEAIVRGTYTEIAQHRERWIAHAATPDGAPAAPDQPAPSWWREVADEDWARLIFACYEAGPGRYEKLGEPPKPKDDKAPTGETFGAVTILAAWGVRVKIRPADLMSIDYGQQLAELRAASPPSFDEMET